ncbi:MAG: helix-turn-helix domain-containing protein [bacterium]|nr:helix-turn-helix domain-containing protein [bacterium]
MTDGKKIIQSLQEIGLNEKEARIFLVLIKKGISNASQIALLAELPKSSTLDQLNDLARRGFIMRHKKKNSFLFSADLSRLHEAISKQKATIVEREKIVTDLLPALEKLEGFGSKRPQIEYLEGDSAIEEAFEDFLRVKIKEVLGYGSIEWNKKSVPNFFPKFYGRRVAARIGWRGVLVALKETLEDTWGKEEKNLWKLTYSSPQYYSSIEVNVYGNNVAIVSQKEKFLVRIRSREVAQAFRHILNLAEQGSRGYDAAIREEIKQKGLKQYLKEHKEEIEKALREE